MDVDKPMSTAESLRFPSILNNLQVIYYNRPTSTPELIKFWANVYQVDEEKALRIAKAESGLSCTAKNKDSSASGLFQIIKSTKKSFDCEGDVFNCEDNIICAMKILKTSGDSHWLESKSNWK